MQQDKRRRRPSPWQRWADRFLRRLGQYALSVFFRQIALVGAERLPAGGPLIVVANHMNSLVDGALLVSFLPRQPRLIAASTVWEEPLLAPLLNLADVIPVYRRRDRGHAPRRNEETFSRCWDHLEAGGAMLLFPEGVSHDEPFLMPIRTGAARIALDAERERGPLGVEIVPVGLVFEAKNRFRSRVLLQIGDPVGWDDLRRRDLAAGSRAERHLLVRELTGRIAHDLDIQVPQFSSWRDARLNALVAGIWERMQTGGTAGGRLETAVSARRALLEGYAWARENEPARLAEIRLVLAGYDRLLRVAGLSDAQATGAFVLRLSLRQVFGGLALSPFALIGAGLNALPYLAAMLVSHHRLRDKQATWAIFSSLLFFPGAWLTQAALAGLAALWLGDGDAGGAVGLAVTLLLAGPLCGHFTLRFRDRMDQIWCDVRARIVLKKSGKYRQALDLRRREAESLLSDLVARYRQHAPG